MKLPVDFSHIVRTGAVRPDDSPGNRHNMKKAMVMMIMFRSVMGADVRATLVHPTIMPMMSRIVVASTPLHRVARILSGRGHCFFILHSMFTLLRALSPQYDDDYRPFTDTAMRKPK
jgi:hypothetical protein